MHFALALAPGTLVGYAVGEKDARHNLSLRLNLEGAEVWRAFEALMPGLEHVSRLIAGSEGEVGAVSFGCHTPIENLTLYILTRESDDPRVPLVEQLVLDDCQVKGGKTCSILLDGNGEGTASLHLLKRIAKEDLRRLSDLKGADLFFAFYPTQAELPLAPKTTEEA
jgi:hypothetical protein